MGFAQVAFITCFTLVWTLKASYKKDNSGFCDGIPRLYESARVRLDEKVLSTLYHIRHEYSDNAFEYPFGVSR